jgi:hypothetical protein
VDLEATRNAVPRLQIGQGGGEAIGVDAVEPLAGTVEQQRYGFELPGSAGHNTLVA